MTKDAILSAVKQHLDSQYTSADKYLEIRDLAKKATEEYCASQDKQIGFTDMVDFTDQYVFNYAVQHSVMSTIELLIDLKLVNVSDD